MGEFADLMMNADGSLRDGTPYQRPDTTPAEQEMSEMQLAIMEASSRQNRTGWWERQWDRLAFQNAKPGDNIAQTMWGEVSEAGSSFMSGLRRSRFNYAQATQNSAEWVADKFGLQFDAKRDFLAASLNKWKNMRINPTTEEWEDQLFYLMGMLAPDAVGLVLGGGVVGGAVSMGAKAAGWSKSAASVATILGRVTGDVAINTTQFMAHEAAQAEIEGRDAEYARAGKEAIAMGLLMSTTARASKAFGLSRKSSSILTGSVLGGTTALYYDDNDPAKADAVAANAVLGGLFGLAVPQTSRVGSRDIQTWVRLKREAGQEPTPEAFYKEFLPESYDKVFKSEPLREDKLYTGHWSDPEMMSPKDDFLMFLSQTTKKNTFGYSDNNLIHLIADLADEHALGKHKRNPSPKEFSMLTEQGGRPKQFEIVTGVNRAESLKHAKVLMDAMNETDAAFMKDHPDYKPRVEQPHTPPYYEPKEKLIRTKDGSKEREAGIIAKNKDGSYQAHELSWSEFKALEGDTPINKEFHLNEVRRAATAYNPKARGKKTWPNKGAIIEHNLWDDYGFIHARPKKGFTTQPAAKTGRQIADKSRQNVMDNHLEASMRVKGVLEKSGVSGLDKVYKWLVDPAGRLFNELEKLDMLPVRNALQLQSLKKGKVQTKLDEVEGQLDFFKMSKEEDSILTAYVLLSSELDAVKRKGHEKNPIDRGLPQRPEQIHDALRMLRDDADKELGHIGGWDKLKDKVKYVEDMFAEMFEELHKAGVVGKKTYDILKDYKYTPQKTIKEAVSRYEDHILKRGKKQGDLDVTDTVLKDLSADADLKGRNTNLEALMSEHIAYVYSLTAKNQLFAEMAKVPSEFWSFEKPIRMGGEDLNFVKHQYMKDGVETPVWVEKRISTLLEAKGDRMLGGDLHTALRMVTGVHPIQMTAVATNPFFAIFTHPLDLWSIATHHQALPKFVPTIIKDMYVHNSETGAFPMIKNFAHAWKKDDVYKNYVENDGTISTIVSSVSAQEMIRRSTNMMDKTKMTERFKRGWNKSLLALGRFGHTMEVAMRMTETDMLVKTGKYTSKEAAHESLRRLNYNRRGEFMHVLDSVVPFANAQAQILASQMSEIKTVKGAARVASTISQLTLGLALTRVLVEEHFPGYMKDVPWDARMRYWIIPTGAKEIDHKSGQEVQHYFKIKKAYNPFFMLANAGAELGLDLLYYGQEGLPPKETIELFMDALAVATPIELQNNIPPIGKVLLAYTGNVDFGGRKVYRGPEVEARDEINTELMGGNRTHNASIATGNLLGMSPARLQAATDSYVARNPLTWFAGSFVETPPEASVSAMTQIVKTAGLRGMVGSTNKKWAEYEAGIVAQKEAGSSMYHEYHAKVLKPLAQLYNRDIGRKEFLNQVKALIKDSKPSIKLKMIGMAQREVKAKAFMDSLLKKYPADLVYDYLQPYAFWLTLARVNAPEYRAKMYYDRMSEIDDPFWTRQFKKMAATRGLFNDRFFAAEYRKLQRGGK